MKNELIATGFNFESAHRLDSHTGKCKNLHGHSYQVEVGFIVETDPTNGMTVDFGVLKGFVSEVVDSLDHSFIYSDDNETDLKLGKLCEELKLSCFNLGVPPTSENLSEHLFVCIDRKMGTSGLVNRKLAKISYVRLWETRKYSAIYRGE